ncbi:30S ribosomal protein S5 [Candidatus Kaiserbacteria bacterium CG10_big_fil_rev_8_21_14_0_10_43_70]|uniref:Small ribosomal subunit protein uS5 n=1 Tax=Candidatus Kaiserbacteria bacterium CG10_big_fil_rev_8_21_14_0_10_43_70 TaxID=1974605 RepID=A0A2H0UJF5_9BACT|nr:MAG: 30S ribosomal protein S5 [Candidatus Kaiserbacteria bacterium CG10_big_fil_rev_8_21_14_0_10_43_70]
MTDDKKTIEEDIAPTGAGDVAVEKKVERMPRKRGSKAFARRKAADRERRSEFDQKIIGIRRVTRVMAGGRRFSFSVAMVIGDKKGRVGFGVGKASDTALAIEKASKDAKKNMITILLTENKSIDRNVSAKYCASEIEVRPARGRGLVAGSAVRSVLELAGVTDVTAKILSRSKSPINNARAAMVALKEVSK